MKKTTVTGLIISATWIIILLVIIFLKKSDASKLSLNEWGDLLSGFMSPLALFWVILGYLQQGEELRLNTEALKSQQTELANQVKETAELVRASERHAKATEAVARASAEQAATERSRQLNEAIYGRR